MRRCWGVLICLGMLAGSLYSEERGPSTPDERKHALAVIEKLEADPISPDLASDREWVHKWLIEVPDVQVPICTAITQPLNDERNSDPRKALQLQQLLAMAAFMMKRPEEAKDPIKLQMAGAEGMIRAYANITRRMPMYKSQFMEDLRVKEQSGTLESFVRQGTAECRARNAGVGMQPMKP
jgi:hypothetical protein